MLIHSSVLASLPFSLLLLIFPCHHVAPCLANGHPNGGAHSLAARFDHNTETYNRHAGGMALVQDFSGYNHWVYWNNRKQQPKKGANPKSGSPSPPPSPTMAGAPMPDNSGGPLLNRASQNLQSFKQAIGGIGAPPITMSTDMSRPFAVMGDTFPDFATAATRTCDDQHNMCSNAANQKKPQMGNFTVGDCDKQLNACMTAQKSAAVQSFGLQDVGPDPNDPDFELFCEP